MICAIHQPHYLPWGPLMQKVLRSDVFILLDDVEFTNNGWQNRNKVKSANAVQTLTIPIYHKAKQKINETRICQHHWKKKHLRTIHMHYHQGPYFEKAYPEFQAILERDYELLADLNYDMLLWHMKVLRINTPVYRSSEFRITTESTQRVIDLIKTVGCNAYYCGRYALQTYFDQELLRSQGIELIIQEWQPKEYPQLYPRQGFIPNLAVLDMIMNVGTDASHYCR